VIAWLWHVQAKIEASCERLGLSYPWWIPAYSSGACVVLDVIAFAQRGVPTLWVSVAAVLALSPVLVWASRGWLMPPWIESALTTIAVALFLTHPVAPDFAPLLLMIAAGEVAATSTLPIAMSIAAVQIVVLVVAADTHHLQSASLFIVGVILGGDVGFALRWQMRALAAERANTDIARQQAMLAERQRLAREVHDVVGHSLSITLLHVTAARHALARHGDVTDALESLGEAEKVGRGAMGDLRRTVTVLGSNPEQTLPLPGIEDVPRLIEQSRSAGLDIRFEASGDSARLGEVAGLGLYRILQECLANIAKHAPTGSASVCLSSRVDAVHLSVRNTVPAGGMVNRDVAGKGTGLAGMAARAEQMGAVLRSGVDGDSWLVDLTVPAGAS
jgi:signal transduction histidine kinase